MPNPYKSLPDDKFWKKAVAERPSGDIHPRSGKRFSIARTDVLATAGSCFAQNVAKYLRAAGSVQVLEAEELRAGDPIFSGRYGNIYTARQMLQLFDEVMGDSPDTDCAVTRRADGRFVDINRPFIEEAGFETPDEAVAARAAHVGALKRIFTETDLFVFTLGLTEAWENQETGKVYPVCPGVYSDDPGLSYIFRNFSYEEVLEDMSRFIAKLSEINPKVKVLLTVSPVPLTATYADDDVMTATMLSKSILRAVCGALVTRVANAYYFPSYEMIANPFVAGSAYADNLRSVRPDAIEAVMKRFEADYVGAVAVDAAMSEDDDVVCDDVEIENSMGF